MSTVSLTVQVPSRRTILTLLTVLVLALGAVWAVSAIAAPTAASNAGLVTIAKGKRAVTIPAGMDLTAESKAQATAMTATTVGVRSIVANQASDTLRITLTRKAKKPVVVSWMVTNGSHPADSVDVAALEARLVSLEATLAGVSRVDFQGQPTIRFSGVNVQVVDGQDDTTDGPTNGRGNLIVGWNENISDIRTGSHNLVVGIHHSYTSFGGMLAGYNNTLTNGFASVTGGVGNYANGYAASVSGGGLNVASGHQASITGGRLNTASGSNDSIVGGDNITCNSAGLNRVCGEGALTQAD